MRLLAPNGEIYLVVTTKGDVSLDVSSLFGELMEVNQTSVSEHPFLGYFYRLPGVGMPRDFEDKIKVCTYTLEPRKIIGDTEIGSPVMSSMTSSSTTEQEVHDRNRLNCNEINRLRARIVVVAEITHGVMTDDELEPALYDFIQVTLCYQWIPFSSPFFSPYSSLLHLQAEPSLNVLDLRNLLVAGTLDPATLPQVKQLNRVLYDMKEKNLIVCGPPKVGTKSKKPTWTIM